MKTLILCIGFYSLGVFNCAVFLAVYLLHRPRYVAPTKRREREREEKPFVGVVSVAGIEQLRPDNLRRRANRDRLSEARTTEDESGVNYTFINLTGIESE